MSQTARLVSIDDQRELIALRRRIAELEDEIAEWERGERNALKLQIAAEELAVTMERFGLTRAQAKICLAFAKSPGRVLAHETLERVARLDDGDSNLIHVQLSLLRKALIVSGFWMPFANVHGVGWRMESQMATEILRAIGPN